MILVVARAVQEGRGKTVRKCKCNVNVVSLISGCTIEMGVMIIMKQGVVLG